LKRIFTLFLALAMISTTAFARAGKSYSRSSSKSHSSSSYSSQSRSYSSPSYSRPSQSYTRPSGTSFSQPHTKTTTPTSRPAPVVTAAPRSTTTVNRTTNNYSNDRGSNGYNRNDNDGPGFGGNGGGGMGIGGTIAGVAGGIVVGNLLISALMGHPANASHVPAGGYHESAPGVPSAGQPVAPAMAGATEGSYVTDGHGGVIPASEYIAPVGASVGSSEPQTSASVPVVIAPVEPSFDWFSWYMWLIYIALGIALVIGLVRLYKRWQVSRLRKLEVAQMLQEEQNLGLFRTIFSKVQQFYTAESRVGLIDVTTPEMYQHIMMTKSSNDDQGLTNIVEEVQVLSLVSVSSWETDGVQFQQVKIRFSMIDYVVDQDDNVIHGSKDTPEKSVEYWTFESRSKDSWQLCSIDQHAGYVAQ